ncbi:hypothetical protein Clacol_004706 [Clathrus columnatus]|uniref:NAD(P)-binding protein n=1 Tax=Clathrus columnatus TaxID=1419009 RepID=A0AAV5AEV2_9AGAM|nr:hypothetical protein Clacol_004706 [Clathrus columnatus]
MTSILSSALLRCAPDSELSQTMFPPPPKFIPERDLPDLSGKIIFITGGNAGCGYQTVKELLLKNAKVYSAARSVEKAQIAADQLKRDIGKSPILIQLDLGDLASVKRAALDFLSKEDRLDVLFNNAGVMMPPSDQLTTQNFDLQFGTNVLGHYYLTMLLLPALKRSLTVNGKKARIVNLSSSGHSFAPGDGIDWSVLKESPERTAKVKEWGPSKIPGRGAWRLYGISKIGNIMLTHLFNRYYHDFINSYSVHPGGISTELQRFGSINQLWAGIMPEAENAVGAYIIPWARIGKADPRSDNEELQEQLRAYLEEQIRPFENTLE